MKPSKKTGAPRGGLPRIHPGRKLTEEQWEELRLLVETDDKRTVKELCAGKGVSVQRFYKRFPKGVKPGAASGIGGGEASDLPPNGLEPADTP